MQQHEGEKHKREVFMKCPAINQLQDDEWHNQGGADQQRSAEGL
jgi:sarcosine oxidase delta subunit